MKFLTNKKGFSLIECIVSIGIFALMSLIVFQIMAVALKQSQLNNTARESKEEQLQSNSDGSGFEADPGIVSYEDFDIIFYDKNGAELSINGKLANYLSPGSPYSILKPQLNFN